MPRLIFGGGLMLFTIVILVLAVLFLKFVPVKQQVLMEGVFKGQRLDYDFMRAKEFKSFVFEDFCKECVEKWRRTGEMPDMSTLGPACYAGIHTYSLNIGSLKPKAGDVVRMIGYQTVFGRVRLYYFEKSDFVWDDLHKEKDRQKAQKRGFSNVEEFKRVREQEYREECIQEIMTTKDLTREEAEVLEFFPTKYGGIFYQDEMEAKRRGVTMTEIENEKMKLLLEPDDDFCTRYWYPKENLADEFAEKGMLEPEVFEHLNNCGHCNMSFFHALADKTEKNTEEVHSMINLRWAGDIFDEKRAKKLGISVEELRERWRKNRILRYGGDNCYTLKERIVCAITNFLPGDRLSHKRECLGCERMLKADREDFLSTGRIGGLAVKEWRESKSNKSTAV